MILKNHHLMRKLNSFLIYVQKFIFSLTMFLNKLLFPCTNKNNKNNKNNLLDPSTIINVCQPMRVSKTHTTHTTHTTHCHQPILNLCQINNGMNPCQINSGLSSQHGETIIECEQNLNPPFVINAPLPLNCENIPASISTIFSEDFMNFQSKIGVDWNYLQVSTVPLVIANDGKILQECDCAIFDSSLFTTAIPHPFTPYHFILYKNVPQPINVSTGVSIEFTFSNVTKFVTKIVNTAFDSYYECTSADPEQDFRSAYSAIGITNFGASFEDIYSINIVACKKKIYLLYGIDFITTNIRDRFHCAIPILDKTGSFNESFTFNLILKSDGSANVQYRDPSSNIFVCLANIPNIGIPTSDRKYVTDIGSRDGINFVYQDITIDSDLLVTFGNLMGMQMMEPIVASSVLPTTTLYNVNGDTTNEVYRYLCPTTDAIILSESTITLPTGTPIDTTLLNYGQGAILRMCNLTASYI